MGGLDKGVLERIPEDRMVVDLQDRMAGCRIVHDPGDQGQYLYLRIVVNRRKDEEDILCRFSIR